MKSIGGFFELEIARGKSLYHSDALGLTTGRACLNFILFKKRPNKVYIPYYCCDALFEPMIRNGIEYEFYSIDENLEICVLPELNDDEIIVYTDFFGIKSGYIDELIKVYNIQLVIDNTHSFFKQNYQSENYSFTSARKYFGVPDGAFLYGPDISKGLDFERNNSISIAHNLFRLIGQTDQGYQEYLKYEKTLNSDILKISLFSEKVLLTINYSEVIKIRNENFKIYQEKFSSVNELSINKSETDCFCYPLLLKKPIDKTKLLQGKIFIPSLWLDTNKRDLSSKYNFECKLSSELLPLPIDHRYNSEDIIRVITAIENIIKN